MSGIIEASYFLIETLFNLYITAVILRLILGYFKADFYNPFSQFLVTITNPVLVPLRRLLPAIGKIDTASFVLAFGLKLLQLTLLSSLVGVAPSLLTLITAAFLGILKLIVWILIAAIFIQSLMSWFGNSYGNPLAPLLASVTQPILSPIRRFLPSMGGMDLSPLVAILILQVVLIFLR